MDAVLPLLSSHLRLAPWLAQHSANQFTIPHLAANSNGYCHRWLRVTSAPCSRNNRATSTELRSIIGFSGKEMLSPKEVHEFPSLGESWEWDFRIVLQ